MAAGFLEHASEGVGPESQRGCKSSENALLGKKTFGRNASSVTGSKTCMVGPLGGLNTVASNLAERCLTQWVLRKPKIISIRY